MTVATLARQEDGLSRREALLGGSLRLAVVAIAAGAFAGFPAVIWSQSSAQQTPLPWSVIALCWLLALGLALLAWLSHRRTTAAVGVLMDRLPGSFVAALLVGLSMRLGVLLVLDPQPASDGATYLRLAQQLAFEGRYGWDGGRAFWPPGLPLLLAPLVWLGLPQKLILLLFGTGCFVVAMYGVKALARGLQLGAAGALPPWLLAIWPTHVLCSALPEKELLVLALMPWIAIFATRASAGSVQSALSAGALLGFAVLVQPSLQLLPAVVFAGALVWSRTPLRAASAALLGTVAMAAVIGPWTARNLATLGAPVLVSSNGGDVLYRANNELATGLFTPRGAVDLSHLAELEIDRRSKQLAFAWIEENPGRFVQLSAGKMLYFLGDSSYGAYAVFGRGGVEVDREIYLGIRLISALPWLALWFVVLGHLLHVPLTARAGEAVAYGLLLLPLLYLTLIHSVFESGPKYHIPLLAIVFVFFAAVVGNYRKQGAKCN